MKLEKCQLMTFAVVPPAISQFTVGFINQPKKNALAIKPFVNSTSALASSSNIRMSSHPKTSLWGFSPLCAFILVISRPLKWNVPVRGSSGNCALFSPCFATLGPNNGTMAAHTPCKTQLPLVQLNPGENQTAKSKQAINQLCGKLSTLFCLQSSRGFAARKVRKVC